MTATPDLYFLDRVPLVGETVGLAGSDADVIIDPTEQGAEGVSVSGGFSAPIGSTLTSSFDIGTTSYQTVAIDCVSFVHSGGEAIGHVITISPLGGGTLQFLFVPLDSAGNLNLSSFTITQSYPVASLGYLEISEDQTHEFVTCFAEGTLIGTPSGPRPVERIAPGDLISTQEHGSQPCLHRLERTVAAADLLPLRQAPVFLPAGALGPDLPHRPILVSRQHRILLSGPIVLAETGHAEVLIAAKELCGLRGICLYRLRGSIRYFHLLCPAHEIIFAEGLPTESFLASDLLPARTREALGGFDVSSVPAKPIVRGQRARALVRRIKWAPLPENTRGQRGRSVASERSSDQRSHGNRSVSHAV